MRDTDGEPTPEPVGARAEGGGRARAERELRTAVLVAVPVLLAGQVVLLAGWWPVAVALGLAGTVAALVLARRWQLMSAADPAASTDVSPPGDTPDGSQDPAG